MTKTNGSFLIGSQPIQLDPDGDYGLSGNLKGRANPRFRFFGGALKYGAEKGTKKGKIKVLNYATKSGKPKTIGEIIFTHEKYLPTLLGKNAPEIMVYHDLERITESVMILLYPNGAILNGYLEKFERDRYLK